MDKLPRDINGHPKAAARPPSNLDVRLMVANGRVDALSAALRRAEELCTRALPQFNWGASALSGEAIALLNEVPGEIHAALAEHGSKLSGGAKS